MAKDIYIEIHHFALILRSSLNLKEYEMFKCGIKFYVTTSNDSCVTPPSHDPRTALTISRGPDIVLMF